MTTLHAVAVARAALLDLFDPLAAFFARLHDRLPHLVDTSSAYSQSFSFALDGTGQAMVLPPTTDRQHPDDRALTPFLDVAHAIGMSGHATTHLLATAEAARLAIDAAAPYARARFYVDPPHPLDAAATFFFEPPKYTRHQTTVIDLSHGALQTTLYPRDQAEDEISWKLLLLARLRSAGRSSAHIVGQHTQEVWADSVHDALLMVAAQHHDAQAADVFLRTPTTVWAQKQMVTPVGLLDGQDTMPMDTFSPKG